jgi:hypothetical protein
VNQQDGSNRNRALEEWLAECSTWWEITTGDEVADFPGLEWEQWYEEGLTVEEAVQRASHRVYGGPGDGE